MDAVGSSETFIPSYGTTRRHIPRDSILWLKCHEKLNFDAEFITAARHVEPEAHVQGTNTFVKHKSPRRVMLGGSVRRAAVMAHKTLSFGNWAEIYVPSRDIPSKLGSRHKSLVPLYFVPLCLQSHCAQCEFRLRALRPRPDGRLLGVRVRTDRRAWPDGREMSDVSSAGAFSRSPAVERMQLRFSLSD